MREVSELSDDTGLPQTLRAKLRLRELILDGGLRGGERLAEQPLAARLGVSRTPLRLAAERLEDAAELEAMHGCVAQLDALVRPDRPAIEAFERYVKLNARFHLLLTKLAKSRSLESAIAQAQAELPESPRILYVAQTQPGALLEAIEEGEGSRAEAGARDNPRLA